jgi:hypothetical protein
MDGKVSLRPYGTQWLYGLMTQDFILHPTDEDLSVGTPALGYFHPLPPGAANDGQ